MNRGGTTQSVPVPPLRKPSESDNDLRVKAAVEKKQLSPEERKVCTILKHLSLENMLSSPVLRLSMYRSHEVDGKSVPCTAQWTWPN